MTPKQKALELRDKYFEILDEDNFHIRYAVAEKCALISVDEILNLMSNTFNWSKKDNGNIHYWREVKDELNKL